ncbi:MAG TPA: hypothetical protein VHL11_14585 [Phototrophicaceae bacterium]|jgi:hypothetical protein|nr:hypothetical protein [Phototrophicaceae bacterium]
MRTIQRFTLPLTLAAAAIALATFAFVPHSTPVAAQDDAPVACDSTLATLVLVAENDYGYLSSMMANADTMAMMPKFEYGQFAPLFTSAMMMDDSSADTTMTDDEMKSMEAMQTEVDKMMGMDTMGMLADYATMTGMTAEGEMVTLKPGDVAGENAACTALRADVEKFLLAHILAEANVAMMDSK